MIMKRKYKIHFIENFIAGSIQSVFTLIDMKLQTNDSPLNVLDDIPKELLHWLCFLQYLQTQKELDPLHEGWLAVAHCPLQF